MLASVLSFIVFNIYLCVLLWFVNGCAGYHGRCMSHKNSRAIQNSHATQKAMHHVIIHCAILYKDVQEQATQACCSILHETKAGTHRAYKLWAPIQKNIAPPTH